MLVFNKAHDFTFRELSSQGSELLRVLEELHYLLQLVLGLLHSFHMLEGDVFHLDRVHCGVQA